MKYLEPADFPVNRVEKSPLVPIFAESRVSQNAFPVKRMMRRVLFWRQSQQWLVILLAAVFASPAFCQVDASTMLEVKGSRAYLFTEPEGRSQVVAELEPGEKLVPLVNVIGSGESWYWVKTQKGTVGWVKASDVQGADQLEKTFKEEYDSFPPPDIKSGQLRSARGTRKKGGPPIPPGNPDLLYSTCPPPPQKRSMRKHNPHQPVRRYLSHLDTGKNSERNSQMPPICAIQHRTAIALLVRPNHQTRPKDTLTQTWAIYIWRSHRPNTIL